jgi:hypothetical protein
MRRTGTGLAFAFALAAAFAPTAAAYVFPLRQLTFDARTKNSLAMNGSVAGWVACERDPIEGESDPPTCEIEIFDADAGGASFAITDNAVEDACVAIHQRDVVFRREIGFGQVILRDLDGGESILSTTGIDTVFYACPLISETRVVWQRGAQIVVYDRALATERVVGSSTSYMDLSGDYVVWQEGDDDVAEIWFLDASSPSNLPQRLTTNAIPDVRPNVEEISTSFSFPPALVTTPSVVWNRIAGSRYEVSSWNGATTTEITAGSAASQFFPDVTDYAPVLIGFEQPLMAWADSDVRYCTTCDGNPANLLRLPESDPFLAGDPNTRVEAVSGGWMVFWRIFPGMDARFDLGFFEIATGTITPITDDPELDDAARLGFRSVLPVGPAVVFRRAVGEESQIFYAPEPGPGALAVAGFALAALRLRRARPRHHPVT